jgi:hypothetical protein
LGEVRTVNDGDASVRRHRETTGGQGNNQGGFSG